MKNEVEKCEGETVEMEEKKELKKSGGGKEINLRGKKRRNRRGEMETKARKKDG